LCVAKLAVLHELCLVFCGLASFFEDLRVACFVESCLFFCRFCSTHCFFQSYGTFAVLIYCKTQFGRVFVQNLLILGCFFQFVFLLLFLVFLLFFVYVQFSCQTHFGLAILIKLPILGLFFRLVCFCKKTGITVVCYMQLLKEFSGAQAAFVPMETKTF